MLVLSVATFVSMPKIVISNNKLINIKDEKNYMNNVRVESITYTFLLSLIMFLVYFIVLNYLLDDYELYYGILFIYSFLYLVDSIIGPTGIVLQYNYNVRYVIYSDFLAICLILVLIACMFFLLIKLSPFIITFIFVVGKLFGVIMRLYFLKKLQLNIT